MTRIIPKTIGGVKTPKKLRKFANRALSDPLIRQYVITALGAVAGVVADRATRKGSILGETIRHTVESAKAVGEVARDKVTTTASSLGESAIFRVSGPLLDGLTSRIVGRSLMTETDQRSRSKKAKSKKTNDDKRPTPKRTTRKKKASDVAIQH